MCEHNAQNVLDVVNICDGQVLCLWNAGMVETQDRTGPDRRHHDGQSHLHLHHLRHLPGRQLSRHLLRQ